MISAWPPAYSHASGPLVAAIPACSGLTVPRPASATPAAAPQGAPLPRPSAQQPLLPSLPFLSSAPAPRPAPESLAQRPPAQQAPVRQVSVGGREEGECNLGPVGRMEEGGDNDSS